jgi:hypothetical protein
MLFILRLTNGDCIVTAALDEQAARDSAMKLCREDAAEVVSVRPINRFAVQFSPTDEGSLELIRWEDATLDDILAGEYPLLEEAYRRANAEPFARLSDHDEPILAHLKTEYERNTKIIREGLRLERGRFIHDRVPAASTGSKKAGAHT